MDVNQLARLPLPTGYVFENGTPFYEISTETNQQHSTPLAISSGKIFLLFCRRPHLSIVLDHFGALPQRDGRTWPAFAGGVVGRHR
jgi:hypothetical protein